MEQPIKKNKFSYFARSRLRLRPQEIWERDYMTLSDVTSQVAQAPYMSSSMLTFALLRNSSDLHTSKDLYGKRNKPEKKIPLNYNKNRLREFQRRFL